MTRVALVSVHTCPLAALGGKETGGMNVYVREVARELSRLGVAVDVFTRSQDPGIARVVPLAEGARVVHLEAGPRRPLPRAGLVAHLGAFLDDLERFRREEETEYALVHSHYWLSGVVALELRRRLRVPVVHMFHTLASVKNRVARRPEDEESEERVRAEERIAAEADRIVAATAVERAELAWHCRADPAKIRVIPCGVDLERFRPADPQAARERIGLPAERVLLFVGRLTPIKGLETLLRALAVAKADGLGGVDTRLVVVGGDKEEPSNSEATRLRRMARDLGVGAWVDFRGPQPQHALPDYYAAADVCLMPSLHESFGMVALEAMACGVPVIASRVGGLVTTIQDGVTGLLVPEGDPAALARGLAWVLADDDRRRGFGHRAAEWGRRFGWPTITRLLLELYGELVPALRVLARPSRCHVPR
jgi:D-inositol-3-phosphate glycosyltransferase